MSAFEAIYEDVSQRLQEGCARAKHPYHLVSVACVNDHHGPEIRTVVLRAFDAQARRLRFHADIRSPKVMWLRANPQISLLFYDAESKLQLRFSGTATIHHEDAVTQAQWEQTRNNSKSCYLAEHGSGVVVQAREACGVSAKEMKVDDDAKDALAYSHFCVVESHFQQLDYVYLKHDGHERALLQWGDDGVLQGSWLAV